MGIDRHPLIFGPAYLDFVLEIDRPLAPGVCLDQNVLASPAVPRTGRSLVLRGATGDDITLRLPVDAAEVSAEILLLEPILARRFGQLTTRVVQGEFSVIAYRKQLGGMGAGYAKALAGTLRFPAGDDDIARFVLAELAKYEIDASPVYLAGVRSDCSYLLLARGEKIAVGSRTAMTSWEPTPGDITLLQQANAVAFCGASNRVMASALATPPDMPVMCAPSMRNIDDRVCPLESLADRMHYLTLNALEWEHLQGKERFRECVPVISVTDGANGSRVFLHGGEEFTLPAGIARGTVDVNRAGETYGATFLKVLMHFEPNFYHTGSVSRLLARKAAQLATDQATRQLAITGFAFPPDDWKGA